MQRRSFSRQDFPVLMYLQPLLPVASNLNLISWNTSHLELRKIISYSNNFFLQNKLQVLYEQRLTKKDLPLYVILCILFYATPILNV